MNLKNSSVITGENRVTSGATGLRFIGSIKKDLCNLHKTGKDLVDCLQEKGCKLDLHASNSLERYSLLPEIDSDIYLYRGRLADIWLDGYSSTEDIAMVGKEAGLCLFNHHKMALAGIHYTPSKGDRSVLVMLPQTEGTILPFVFCLHGFCNEKHLMAFYLDKNQLINPYTPLMFWSNEESKVVMARLAGLKPVLSD